MKKIIKSILLILVLSSSGFLVYKVIDKVQEKKAIANSIKVIPEFNFMTLDSSMFQKCDIKSNLQTVFIYFNSECEFCQHEAHSISENIDEFHETQIIFISNESVKNIKAFSEEYNLNCKKNILFLIDRSDSFYKLFNATSIPFALFYDKEQNLINTHKGQLNAIGILKNFNK